MKGGNAREGEWALLLVNFLYANDSEITLHLRERPNLYQLASMSAITTAKAYANNLVAFIAWDVDKPIPGSLGFAVTRLYTDGTERPLTAWVPLSIRQTRNTTPKTRASGRYRNSAGAI